MANEVSKPVKRRRVSILRFLIDLNGYRVGALFLLALAFGAHINPDNPIFISITDQFPFLQPGVWEYLFLVCVIGMLSIKSGSRLELEKVLLFFVLPVTTFYLFLFFRATQRMSYFTLILSVLALVINLLFVVRTAAMNFIQEHVLALEAKNRQLQDDNDALRLENLKLKRPDSG